MSRSLVHFSIGVELILVPIERSGLATLALLTLAEPGQLPFILAKHIPALFTGSG
jgi:hypothetical protein